MKPTVNRWRYRYPVRSDMLAYRRQLQKARRSAWSPNEGPSRNQRRTGYMHADVTGVVCEPPRPETDTQAIVRMMRTTHAQVRRLAHD